MLVEIPDVVRTANCAVSCRFGAVCTGQDGFAGEACLMLTSVEPEAPPAASPESEQNGGRHLAYGEEAHDLTVHGFVF